jgi:hypothetical protein
MNMESDMDELCKRFKFVCRKCGSENVVMDFERGTYWSDLTGSDPDEIVFGCNDCKDNDFRFYA